MKDLPFRRWWELGDKVGGVAAAGPSPGNREFSDSSDTVVLRRMKVAVYVSVFFFFLYAYI